MNIHQKINSRADIHNSLQNYKKDYDRVLQKYQNTYDIDDDFYYAVMYTRESVQTYYQLLHARMFRQAGLKSQDYALYTKVRL